MTTTPLLIYGSCVSRDIVRILDDTYTSGGYIARQTFISAFSRPSRRPEDWGITSKFQIKNLNGDFASNAARRIRTGAAKSDVMLIDLASEKHGIFEVGENRYVSATPTLRATPYYKKSFEGRRIPFGASEHLDLFGGAAEQLKDLLVDSGVFPYTAVLNAPFTDKVIDGPDLTGSPSAAEWNEKFSAYYDLLRELGFELFPELPTELAQSTETHSWGKSQDHYVDAAYQWWGDRIEEFKKQRGTIPHEEGGESKIAADPGL